jgi:hypothetical protein
MDYNIPEANIQWSFILYTHENPTIAPWSPVLRGHCYDAFYTAFANCVEQGRKGGGSDYETSQFYLQTNVLNAGH